MWHLVPEVDMVTLLILTLTLTLTLTLAPNPGPIMGKKTKKIRNKKIAFRFLFYFDLFRMTCYWKDLIKKCFEEKSTLSII